MNDTHPVTVRDPGRNPAHRESRLLLGQISAGVYVVQEVSVVCHLQHEIDLSRGLHQTVESKYAGVTEVL